MDIKAIIKDAKENFLQKGNSEFWTEDGNPDEEFMNIINEHKISNGADVFSIISALLSETTVYFKKQGKVSIKLWKIVLNNISKKLFEKLDADYDLYMKGDSEKGILGLRNEYKAPMPQVLIEADDLLNKINELKPIKDMATKDDEETNEFIRATASNYMADLLELYRKYNKLEVADTPYMVKIDALYTYKQTLDDAFELLIEFSTTEDDEQGE